MIKQIGNIGQWLGVLLFILAIIFLCRQAEDITETLIVFASFVFTVATKVKYYEKKRKRKKLITINELIKIDELKRSKCMFRPLINK